MYEFGTEQEKKVGPYEIVVYFWLYEIHSSSDTDQLVGIKGHVPSRQVRGKTREADDSEEFSSKMRPDTDTPMHSIILPHSHKVCNAKTHTFGQKKLLRVRVRTDDAVWYVGSRVDNLSQENKASGKENTSRRPTIYPSHINIA